MDSTTKADGTGKGIKNTSVGPCPASAPDKTIEQLQREIYQEPVRIKKTDYEQFMTDEVW